MRSRWIGLLSSILTIVVCSVSPGASPGVRAPASASMFPNPVYDVGGLPFCATSADLDHDRRLDLIVCSNRENGGLTVLKGLGNGLFEPGVRIETGWAVESVLTGDFNHDRERDLLAVQDGRILVLPGIGDGQFSKPIETILKDARLRSGAVSDFNQDGEQDLAVASLMSGTVEILFGRDGSFSPQSSAAVGGRPWSVAAGDFDGDGRTDLASVNTESHEVTVLYGRGQGRFGDARRVALDPKAYPAQHAVVAGNLNGDGRADLVVSHQDLQLVSVLLGSQDEALIPRGDYPVGNHALPPEIVDLNGDGRMDILVGGYSSNDVSVLLGDGKGGFSPRRQSHVCEGPGAAIAGRFDADSLLDVAVACRNGWAAAIFHGNGDGTFGPAPHAVQNALKDYDEAPVVALAAGDFDGDGRKVLALATSYTDRIIVMRDFVNGAPRSQSNYEVGWNPTSLTVGRFNKDRVPDLAVAVRNFDPHTDGPTICTVGGSPEPQPPPRGEVVVLLGEGDGLFGPPSRIPVGFRPAEVEAVDLNGDGLDDLLVANQGEPRIDAPAYLSVVLSAEDGTFAPERRLFEGTAFAALAVSDFDGDGRPDLAEGRSDARRHEAGTVAVHPGAGDGTFGEATILDSAWRGGCLAAGDLDADGKADLVETNAGSMATGSYGDGSMTIFYSRPGGDFARSGAIQAGPPLCGIVDDFNHDQRPDLAVLNWSHEISILLGSPAGSFQPRVRFSAAGPIERFLAADLDGDGRPDLAAGVKGSLSVLMNRGTRRR
jgi:hypothetical protein